MPDKLLYADTPGRFSIRYGDGSGAEGTVAKDYVNVAGIIVINQGRLTWTTSVVGSDRLGRFMKVSERYRPRMGTCLTGCVY